ncbi:MAG: LysR family transcriptional regulator [Roseibium sp.]|uniref:LysR family transcriptional regulator n=1 Tax=Roseibium sp. TaxID=1936156 RepID=UPI0026160EEC|nr:LysR family transcriptional regulator [Roseibium sp.]MCV0424814.1 LysR family transcriptional regulator [Roseibium sp.]
MAIKLGMLRVFRTVAEQGTLAGAADALGRTPSALSMMLAQLEEELGAPLFETDRKNRLTPLGELVLAESTNATDTFDRSQEAIRRYVSSTAGTVRIVTVPSATVTMLPERISAFSQQHPLVRLEISDADSRSVRRRIRLEEADIGIVTTTPDAPEEGSVVLQDDLGIVFRQGGEISQKIRAGKQPSWSFARLEPFIGNALCALVENATVREVLANCTLEARNTTALLSFVREGLGATILPEGAIAHQSEEIGFARPCDPVAQRQLRMIRNPDRRLSPVAEEFWRCCQNAWQNA